MDAVRKIEGFSQAAVIGRGRKITGRQVSGQETFH